MPKSRARTLTQNKPNVQGQYVQDVEMDSWVFICDNQKQKDRWQQIIDTQLGKNEVMFTQTMELIEIEENLDFVDVDETFDSLFSNVQTS